jgi:hypothetical protein
MSKPVLAAAAAALLLTLAPVAAFAKDLALSDEAGDVWVQQIGETTWKSATADEAEQADVRRLLTRHGDTTILLRAKIADITKSGTGHSLVARVVTNERVRRSVVLWTTANNRAGSAVMYQGGTKVCKGKVSRRVDYAKNTMTVRFPRGCLSGPRWVRVRAETGWGSDYGVAAYQDNPHNDDATSTAWSSRVYRG